MYKDETKNFLENICCQYLNIEDLENESHDNNSCDGIIHDDDDALQVSENEFEIVSQDRREADENSNCNIKKSFPVKLVLRNCDMNKNIIGDNGKLPQHIIIKKFNS